MILNVQTVQIDRLKEYCVDYRIKETDALAVVAVILKPYPTRSDRLSALEKIKQTVVKDKNKQVLVTADIDLYCRLGEDNCDVIKVLAELYRRNSYV